MTVFTVLPAALKKMGDIKLCSGRSRGSSRPCVRTRFHRKDWIVKIHLPRSFVATVTTLALTPTFVGALASAPAFAAPLPASSCAISTV